MNMKKSRIVLSSVVIFFTAVTSLSSNATSAYSEESSFSVPKTANSKMSSALDKLIRDKMTVKTSGAKGLDSGASGVTGLSAPETVNRKMADAISGLISRAMATKPFQAGIVSTMTAAQKPVYQGKEKIRVIFETRGNNVNLEDIASYGGEIIAESDDFVAAEMPPDKIEDVMNNVSGIEYARLPQKFFRCAMTSEGVGLTFANILHSAGFTGQGVKIAVIDVGFKGLSAAQANGDLPANAITRDFTGTGLTTQYKHGTACAEIVYDMAPSAELHLLKVSDEVDIRDALNYCIANGIKIVSASIGTFGPWPGNGTGSLADACDLARAAGILVVVAAGNSGNSTFSDGTPYGTHWQGPFVSDSYNNHLFVPGDLESWYNAVAAYPTTDDDGNPETGEVSILLRWNDWINRTTDYDLWLLDYATGNLVAYSNGTQNGSQPPVEYISINLSGSSSVYSTYGLVVTKKSTSPAGKDIEIYLSGTSLFPPFYKYSSPIATSASSLSEPADTQSVFAVGAIKYSNWANGPQENFSSQGPTNAWAGSSARTKPDICGPDGVSGYSYGSQSFYGTSAATPHTAGAAALILSMHPYLTVSQLQSVLESNAVDMGSAGKDNLYGNGRLKILVYNSAPVLDTIDPKTVNENSALSFSLNASDPDGDSITYTTSNLPTGSTFDLGTRTFRWTPTYSQAGSYTNVRFQVSDGKNVDYEDITITVVNVNRPPVVSAIPASITKNEGDNITPGEINLATDPDNNTLTYTYSGWQTSLPYSIGYDDAGTHTLHVEVSDGIASVGKDITITVNNTNRAPFLDAIGNKAISENSELAFVVSATDPDGGSLTYSASNLPQGASFDPATRRFSWTPTKDQAGTYTDVRFQVSDGEATDFKLIVITVDDVTTPDPTKDLDGDGKDDLVIDFGPQYGIWIKYGGGAWSQLHTIGPESITTSDLDGDGKADVIIDFGSEYGIWVYYSNGSWTQLHNVSAKTIIAADIDGDSKGDLIVDFGSQYGIWVYYSNGTWAQLHNVSAKSITAADIDGDSKADIVIDFGDPYGIWIRYSNGAWVQLHNVSARSVNAGDIDGDDKVDIVIDFGDPYGIWVRYSNDSWVQLHNVSSKSIVTGDIDGDGKSEVIVDFGATYGIWAYYSSGSWVQLHNVSAKTIAASDIDGNGKADLVINFGDPYGIWVCNDDGTWWQLHNVSP